MNGKHPDRYAGVQVRGVQNLNDIRQRGTLTAVFEIVGTRELRRVVKSRPLNREDLGHIFPQQKRDTCPSHLGLDKAQQQPA